METLKVAPVEPLTLTLTKAYEIDAELFGFVNLNSNSLEEAFIKIFVGMYGEYEIAGETIGQQYKYMEHTFMEYQDYYMELLSKYGEEYPTLEELGTITQDSTNLHSDLPNKKLPDTDYFSYPTSSDKGHSSTSSPADILRNRSLYLRQVRSILHEFCSRFNDCFIHIF